MDANLLGKKPLGIVCGFCVQFALASVQGSGASDPAPPVIRDLPEPCRRTSKEHCDARDSCSLFHPVLLPEKRWIVSTLRRCGQSDPRLNAGWLAVSLETGEAKFLAAPERVVPQDEEDVYEFYRGWRNGSCVVGLQVPRRSGRKTPAAEAHGLAGLPDLPPPWYEWFFWEWHPQQGTVSPLGWREPNFGRWTISSLVQSLEGTGYELESWDSGRLCLRDAANNQRRIEFAYQTHFPDAEGIPGRFAPRRGTRKIRPATVPYGRNDPWYRVERFAVTDDNQSLAALVFRYDPKYESAEFALRRIHLDPDLRIEWDCGPAAVEQAVGGKIGTVRVIEGTDRPCRWLPILFHPEGGHPEQGPLWLLDVRTGELRGPQKMPWPRVTDLSDGAMEITRIAASRDGRLILYSYPRGDRFGRRFGHGDHL